MLLNILVVIITAIVFFVCMRKKETLVSRVLTVAVAAIFCMAIINVFNIKTSVDDVDVDSLSAEENTPTITLSKTEKNLSKLQIFQKKRKKNT